MIQVYPELHTPKSTDSLKTVPGTGAKSWERNSHLLHKVLKSASLRSVSGLGCTQSPDTNPAFTTNTFSSLLMPPPAPSRRQKNLFQKN